MKRLHQFLKVFLFVQLGGCFGRVALLYYDHLRHPQMEYINSAPWWTDILVTLVLTAITASLTTIAYFLVGYFRKKKEHGKTQDKPQK